MNIFVTGGGGFLGKELVSRLRNSGNQVLAPSSKECNLLISESLGKYSNVKFDKVFHLAAWTQAGDFCLNHAGEQWINNQLINTHLLNWWRLSQPQAKLVFMGTSCAYPDGGELHEDNYMRGEPIESLYTYALTKRMLFQGAQALGKQFDLKWFCAVPSTLYGPDYHLDGRQMHFIFDLVRKILRGKYLNEQVILWGDGNQRRELVHVRSFVNILLGITDQIDNKIINIGAGEDYSIREFVKKICQIVDYDEKIIKYDISKYVGSKSKILSINEIKKIIPSYELKLISLEEGLKETIDWLKNKNRYLK